MDYFNIVLTTFWGIECVSCIAVNVGSESAQISNLNLCSESLMGLDSLMTEFSFWTIPLSSSWTTKKITKLKMNIFYFM